MRLLPVFLVILTATFTGSAIWARWTLGSLSSSGMVAFLSTILLAPLLLLLFARGALHALGTPLRSIVLLFYLIGAFATSDLVIEFIRLVEALE
jgi:hypothetical protein